MGTKYSTILVGGEVQTYNDGPPPDDGSQIAANLVKYATITSDLTTPLHSAVTRMDAKLLELVDEGPNTHAGIYTTIASDYATTLECTGTFTLSLLNPSGQAGYRLAVKNAGAGVITVNVDGGALIDGASSLSLAAGDASVFRVNAAADAYYTEADYINTLPVADGGTGATTAEVARVNLGTIGFGEVYALLIAEELI